VSGTDVLALMPYLILAGATIIIMLLIGIRRSHFIVTVFSLLALVIAFFSLFRVAALTPRIITGILIIDQFTLFYLGLLIAATFAIVLLANGYLENQNIKREEFYLLLFLATFGASVLVASYHFVTFFLGLEILSVSLYTLIGYLRFREQNIEAGIKYLILAAASSAFLLFGMALVYADLGTMEFTGIAKSLLLGYGDHVLSLTGFGLMIVGIGFKLAVVPFHMWTPDVYEGAPAPVTAFVATVSKGGMFALLLRFFAGINGFQYGPLVFVFSIIAIASMFIGNFLALMQDNVKRILAYSSIAHLGYLLVAFLASGTFGVEAATYYLVAYFITTIGAFGVITVLSTEDRDADQMSDYQGLFWRRPWLATVFTAMLFSLAGIPLTAGFVGKFYVAAAGVRASLWYLVIILVVNSAIGLYYYLRVVVAMYSKPEELPEKQGKVFQAVPMASFVALLGIIILLVWYGVYPAELVAWIKSMAISLKYTSAFVSPVF
jgi:NADH-quinone oxidoreductase subunit N